MLNNARKERYSISVSVFFVFLHFLFYFLPPEAYNRQMNTATDIELMQALRQGSEAALRELVDRHRTRLYRLAVSLLGDSLAAEDAVQETFIRLWQKARRFDPRYSVVTWLCTICARRCYDEMRRRRRHREAVAAMPSEVVAPDSLAEADLLALLRQAPAALLPKQRVVYQLRELEDLSTDEVAAATRMTVDQVKANLYVARNTVREKLRRYGI